MLKKDNTHFPINIISYFLSAKEVRANVTGENFTIIFKLSISWPHVKRVGQHLIAI